MIGAVVCVLRSGGDFLPEHVVRLHHLVRMNSFCEVPFIALTDVPIQQPEGATHFYQYPLTHDWPGMWAKLEIMRWDLLPENDLLYLDLDVAPCGDLDEIFSMQGHIVLRDFYQPNRIQGSMMLLPPDVRAKFWELWEPNVQKLIVKYQQSLDQQLFEELWGADTRRWQDLLPGQIVSYKKDVRPNNNKIPGNARLIVFHGLPRPWQVKMEPENYEIQLDGRWL